MKDIRVHMHEGTESVTHTTSITYKMSGQMCSDTFKRRLGFITVIISA